MAEDWNQHEVDRTVEVYFTMLGMELAGESFSKAELRRQLRAELNHARTEASFEFKFQNISAVLQELGAVFVDGYKPARNAQQLLRERVRQELDGNSEIRRAMMRVVTDPAPEGTVLQSPVDAPELSIPEQSFESRGRRIDFIGLEAANRSLGSAGEQAVVEYERVSLQREGRHDLADRVEHVAETVGDGLGFDVLSFHPRSGTELRIEVKTTRRSRYIPFQLTRNELAASEEWGSDFVLCRVFGFGASRAQQYRIPGPLGPELDLATLSYLAYPRRNVADPAS